MAKQLTVQWTGLDSFKHELQALTTNMVDEANTIMRESATQAKADIAVAYPAKSGRLRTGLVIRDARGVVLAGVELVQTAPHGWIFEHGTKPRENRQGNFRGVMPARPTLIPIASAYRQGAIALIIDRLYAHGASRVTGQAEEQEP
jgi:hypothetical protein